MAASIHVTKFAAAERQLRAGIRLFFEEEDELAIHTVASAAYRLLSDLKDDRGMDEAADTHLTSIFYAVRSYKRGTLPKHMTSRPELMAQIAELAAVLPIEDFGFGRLNGLGLQIEQIHELFFLAGRDIKRPELFVFEPGKTFAIGRPLNRLETCDIALGGDGVDRDRFFLGERVQREAENDD